eukprot:Colp12_sorted_trinity150504_noHs@12329
MEYGAPKRMRIDELGGSVPAPPVPMDPNTMSAPMMGAGPNMGGKRPRDDSGIDPHAPPPSRVVHVRAVPEGAQSGDIMAAISAFGEASYIVMMPRSRQALVEMTSLESAIAAVEYNKLNPIFCMGRPIYFNYSKSKEINRSQITPTAAPAVHGGAPSDDMGATRILLLTIINPLYPITTEVIHAIATPYGLVEKIVIFHKNGVQALVQYDNAQSASRAKASLQGADIYAGCCTLKVDFSRVDQLNVRKNDDLTWDYTSGASGPASAPPPTNY